MEFLFIVENANLHGGTEILTFNLLHALRNKGKDSLILSINPYHGDDEHVLSLTDNEYDEWKRIYDSMINKILLNKFSDNFLKKILKDKIRRFNPKLVINQTLDIITALPLDKNIGQVFNWSLRGYEKSLLKYIGKCSLIKRVINSIYIKLICNQRYKILNKIPKLIVLSNSGSEELKSINSKIKDKNIYVIPDPLNFTSDSNIISSLHNKNLVFVGRLSHEKGVMRLLRIWKFFNKDLPQYTLSIYGDGELKKDMIQYIKENKINNVFIKGYCQNLEKIYSSADLLCVTSDTEGFGMVIIEAMYFGVPCISFDCPVSPKEIIDNTGIIVPCYDEQAYKRALISLVNDENKLRTLQKNCIIKAREYFICNILKKWESL